MIVLCEKYSATFKLNISWVENDVPAIWWELNWLRTHTAHETPSDGKSNEINVRFDWKKERKYSIKFHWAGFFEWSVTADQSNTRFAINRHCWNSLCASFDWWWKLNVPFVCELLSRNCSVKFHSLCVVLFSLVGLLFFEKWVFFLSTLYMYIYRLNGSPFDSYHNANEKKFHQLWNFELFILKQL